MCVGVCVGLLGLEPADLAGRPSTQQRWPQRLCDGHVSLYPGVFKVPHKLYSRCLFPSQNAGTSFTSRDDGQLLECERVPAAHATEGGTYGHPRNEWQLCPPVKIVCCLCVCVCPVAGDMLPIATVLLLRLSRLASTGLQASRNTLHVMLWPVVWKSCWSTAVWGDSVVVVFVVVVSRQKTFWFLILLVVWRWYFTSWSILICDSYFETIRSKPNYE